MLVWLIICPSASTVSTHCSVLYPIRCKNANMGVRLPGAVAALNKSREEAVTVLRASVAEQHAQEMRRARQHVRTSMPVHLQPRTTVIIAVRTSGN
jgi:hypothetical protein